MAENSRSKYPRFCKASSLWNWTKAPAAYLGAYYLRLLRIFVKRPRAKFFLPISFFIFGLAGIVFFVLFESPWAPLQTPAALQFGLVFLAIGYLATLGIPLGLWFGYQARTTPINRVLHFDSFLALVSMGLVVWTATNKHNLQEASPALLWIAANHWIYQALRLLEASFMSAKIDARAENFVRRELPFPMTKNLHQEIERFELLTMASGILLVGLALALTNHFTETADLLVLASLGLAPMALPFHQAFSSRIVRRALNHRVYLPKLSHFREISKIRHLRSHHLGVFTHPHVEFDNWWLDPSSVWTETEIEELVASMTRDVSHPICEAIHRRFQNNDLRVRLADLESLPHLGLRVSFRNKEGQILNICLGNLNWFLSELHDLSPEGQREFQKWSDESRLTTFLSINRRVVAGFSFTMQKKLGEKEFFQTLQEQDRPVCMVSSSNGSALRMDPSNFKEIAVDLLPAEREVQLKHWAERAPRFIELRSTWDHPSSDQAYAIIFGRSPTRVSFENHVCILHESLQSSSWLFEEAESWTKQNRNTFVFPLVIGAAGLGITYGVSVLYLPSLILVAFILWSTKRA